MPRKKKSDVVADSAPTVTLLHMTQAENDVESSETHPTELNRLISEEEYSNGRAEVLVMNRTPATSSPSSSNSRHNSQTTPPPPNEDLDKISSERDAPLGEDQVDECTPLRHEDEDVTTTEPNSHHGGEYKKIMEMLKEAEAEENPEAEVEENRRKMEYLIKYNARHPESPLGFVDYCCGIFHCFAMCID